MLEHQVFAVTESICRRTPPDSHRRGIRGSAGFPMLILSIQRRWPGRRASKRLRTKSYHGRVWRIAIAKVRDGQEAIANRIPCGGCRQPFLQHACSITAAHWMARPTCGTPDPGHVMGVEVSPTTHIWGRCRFPRLTSPGWKQSTSSDWRNH